MAQKYSKKSKDEIIDAVMNSAVALEISKGHLKWGMSDLARHSQISRTLIYYYFGKSKEVILQQSIDHIIKEVFDTGIENSQRLRMGQMLDMILRTRNRLRKSPHLLILYSEALTRKGPLGRQFLEAEESYMKMLASTLPARLQPMTKILWAFIFGLTVTPGLTEADLKKAQVVLRRFW